MMGKQHNHIDILLLLAVLTLMMLSLGIVYSASSTYAFVRFGESEKMLTNHAVRVFLGIVALFVGMRIDYHCLQRFTKPGVILAVVLLLVTLTLGGETKGATRWLRLGFVGFQPSEFAKYALLFHLCTLIAVKGDLVRDFRRGFVPMMIWIGIVSGLVLFQPNFSMGAMIFLLSLVMLFLGRARFSHLALSFAALIPLLGVYMMSADYRRARIMVFLSGSGGDAAPANYQLWQGILGFGNGGIFGVGPGESKQRDLFLPESYGDFVFSIVGEEYGFLGTMFFMALFFIIMIRGFRIARHAQDGYGKYLAVGITAAVTVYALVNAGVTLGLFPTTGLPMPFVSYGGSSMVFSAFAVGVVLNISAQTDLYPRAREIPVVGSVNAGETNAGKVY